ncbi:hypothetical protein NA78x_000665 [Anatilimnocola sp. NA78]|uniref:hypothetical protein n=1 Tax=Anatilimnocola sp. NA78 TaxID=3415683 RepID=UPI003CE56511
MLSLSALKSDAQSVTELSIQDAHLRKLAKTVEDLITVVEGLENDVKFARQEASEAKREAREAGR